MTKRRCCEACGRDLYRKTPGAQRGKHWLCYTCHMRLGWALTATGLRCKDATWDAVRAAWGRDHEHHGQDLDVCDHPQCVTLRNEEQRRGLYNHETLEMYA